MSPGTSGVRLKSDTGVAQEPGRLHYGWVILGATLVVLVTTAGFRSTVGILVDPLREEFGAGVAALGAGASETLLGSYAPAFVGAALLSLGAAFLSTRITRPPAPSTGLAPV